MSKKQSQIKDVIVIGAGASGMMAAITAARRGRSVLLIEQMDKIGKKLLATGNGKCNYTNQYMEADCFHGDRQLFFDVFKQFGQAQTVAFFQELGIWPKTRNGYYYPNSEQASSVVDALQMELNKSHIMTVTGCKVTDVHPDKYGITISTSNGNFKGNKLIIASGLLAAPKLGSDGSMISIIKELGHRFVTIVPALCGFYASGMNFKKVSGVRCEAELSLYVQNELVNKEHGELQLTEYGVSGIPVFQISSAAAQALAAKRPVAMQIDFLPNMDENTLREELTRRIYRGSNLQTAGQMLCGLLHQKLIPVLLDKAGIPIHKPVEEIEEQHKEGLVQIIKNYPVKLDKVRDYEFAQVCAGGVRTEEIDTVTLESKYIPGLYFCGEILNVDGICGGYNLQWAWSSGYVAGSHV